MKIQEATIEQLKVTAAWHGSELRKCILYRHGIQSERHHKAAHHQACQELVRRGIRYEKI